eukprot:gnl/TRDRNA2_/TRDRNA2_163365_c3_seq4.p2 gnl/TRDRNA2_/TRDRNA2_163365_c3~~gnl/TRDRNA2_/TRDRNA2_163365_c3_seq4.p2  ORF type:complete len:111 (+),score=18.41 gnl/TRDRNA2_/TRDRNA2_163365_c3_seq4:577-909(+)
MVSQSEEVLFAALAMAIQQRVGEFKTQELTNVAWTFALLVQSDHGLSTLMARAAEQRLLEFRARDFANIMWAFATIAPTADKLFGVLARRAATAELLVSKFIPQDIANTA